MNNENLVEKDKNQNSAERVTDLSGNLILGEVRREEAYNIIQAMSKPSRSFKGLESN